jgi:hypothetical protein
MADARHPKPYPRGPKHPKLGVNNHWKRRVDEALEANRRLGKRPRTRAELARMVKADKSGLNSMLDSDQPTYKYARVITELLHIPPAYVDNPELTDGEPVPEDEWAVYVARVKTLPESEQRRLLRLFRIALEDVV